MITKINLLCEKSFSEKITEKNIGIFKYFNEQESYGISTSMKDPIIGIYDIINNMPLAAIEIRTKGMFGPWSPTMVWAIQGWGPAVYDLAMMFVYPSSLVPSYDITEKVKNIWERYLERKDVKKEVMSLNEPMNIYNTMFKLEPTIKYKRLYDNILTEGKTLDNIKEIVENKFEMEYKQ